MSHVDTGIKKHDFKRHSAAKVLKFKDSQLRCKSGNISETVQDKDVTLLLKFHNDASALWDSFMYLLHCWSSRASHVLLAESKFDSILLANVNSLPRSLFAVARPSVCLSVCRLYRLCALLRLFKFSQYFYGIRYLGAIHWHPLKILRRSPGELNTRGVA